MFKMCEIWPQGSWEAKKWLYFEESARAACLPLTPTIFTSVSSSDSDRQQICQKKVSQMHRVLRQCMSKSQAQSSSLLADWQAYTLDWDGIKQGSNTIHHTFKHRSCIAEHSIQQRWDSFSVQCENHSGHSPSFNYPQGRKLREKTKVDTTHRRLLNVSNFVKRVQPGPVRKNRSRYIKV